MKFSTLNRINSSQVVIPDLAELARRIGRAPRWCGATDRYQWTVLHHHLLVESIALRILTGKSRSHRDTVALHSLVHDLHEGIMGDIPTWAKTPEQRAFQKALDERIYAEVLRIPMPGPKYRAVIKTADERALHAESVVLKVQWALPGWEEESQAASIWEDECDVRFILEQYGSANLVNSAESRGVVDYIEAVESGAQEYRKRCETSNRPLDLEDDSTYTEPMPAEFSSDAYLNPPDLELEYAISQQTAA